MNIVLVHGGGGTPATWTEVIPLLEAAGHTVTAVTNPMTSMHDDIAHTAGVVRSVKGPVLLVGHSYGGAVITGAGHEPNVTGLVYIAAFAPEQGESVNGIVERYPPAGVSKYMRRGPHGEWSSEHSEEYWNEIGWDVAPEQRAVWDNESRQSAAAIYTDRTGEPAWQVKPSWYLVAAQDQTLPTVIQRDMSARMGATVSEVEGSHFTPRVHPAEVVAVIEKALRYER